MNTDIVVFLQNAWSETYAGRHWPRDSWMEALKRSRSGKKLLHMIDDLEMVHNTTQEVTEKPSGKPAPDLVHMTRDDQGGFALPSVELRLQQQSWTAPAAVPLSTERTGNV